VFLLRRPTSERVERVLRDTPHRVTYDEVGVTRGGVPTSLPRLHHRARLGSGSAVYEAAVAAMRAWRMYDLAWTRLVPSCPPVAEGTVFATVVRHLGFWSINPCRVMYVKEDAAHFAFALGTLPGHSEVGEERFEVRRDGEDDAVWFEILAHAAPLHWMARVGTPYTRHLQRRFGRAALAAMAAAVRDTAGPPRERRPGR
jgi:uncharacterized protein (UPF0548 family)